MAEMLRLFPDADIGNGESLIHAGYSLCEIIDSGMNPQLTLSVLTDAGFERFEALDIVHAVALLCPEHSDVLLAVNPYR